MVTTVAVAALALALQPSADPNARPHDADTPPMTVDVYASRAVSPHLVSETLHEAGLVWNDAGITLAWRVLPGGHPEYSNIPHVVIDDDPGRPPKGGKTPIGWVQFTRPDEPDQEIHVSRYNGMRLLKQAQGPGQSVDKMPPAEVDVALGRVLGRALAHELGHYFLRSATHTVRGLMRGSRTIQEFLAFGRRGFEIDAAQRVAIVARIRDLTGAIT